MTEQRTPESIATEIVAKLEHGDEDHRKWLRDEAIPLIAAAIKAEREGVDVSDREIHEAAFMQSLSDTPDKYATEWFKAGARWMRDRLKK